MNGNYLPLVTLLLLIGAFFTSSTPLAQQRAAADNPTAFFYVTVTDERGTPIDGLTKDQFSVFEKKEQLEISSFSNAREPVSVLFMFDVSGSTSPKSKNLATELAYQFALASDPANDYSVLAFNEKIKMVCGWGCRGEELRTALNYIFRIKPDTETAFYDAFGVALTHFQSSPHQKQIMIVFGDGQDNRSKMSFKDMKEKLKRSSLMVYTVGLFRESDIGSSLGTEAAQILDDLAWTSGGKPFYLRNQKEFKEIVEDIREEIVHQYKLGILIPAVRRDNRWRSIKIKITPPGKKPGVKVPKLYSRYREGYFDN